MTQETGGVRIACVGGVVVHGGLLLLVQRGQEPSRGLWSVPGGRLLPGEDLADGCARELLEETGLRVRPGRLVGRVERAAPAGGVYVIDDLLCGLDAVEGEAPPTPVAGDDAADAAWFSRADVDGMAARGELAPGVHVALLGWGVLDLLS